MRLIFARKYKEIRVRSLKIGSSGDRPLDFGCRHGEYCPHFFASKQEQEGGRWLRVLDSGGVGAHGPWPAPAGCGDDWQVAGIGPGGAGRLGGYIIDPGAIIC